MTLDTALKFLKRMAYLHSSVDTLRAKYAELASLLGRNSSLSFLLAEVVESKEDQEQLAEALLHVLTLKRTSALLFQASNFTTQTQYCQPSKTFLFMR